MCRLQGEALPKNNFPQNPNPNQLAEDDKQNSDKEASPHFKMQESLMELDDINTRETFSLEKLKENLPLTIEQQIAQNLKQIESIQNTLKNT